jgi:hypothetical protein
MAGFISRGTTRPSAAEVPPSFSAPGKPIALLTWRWTGKERTGYRVADTADHGAPPSGNSS